MSAGTTISRLPLTPTSYTVTGLTNFVSSGFRSIGVIHAAAGMTEPAARVSQLEQAARIWLKRDPAAARAWLARSDVPPELRARLGEP